MTEQRTLDSLSRLDEITRHLRRECPWDREQDARSIVPHTVEESYELADAAARDDVEGMVDELGDVLFQVLFLSLLLEERGEADLGAVAESCAAKLIRRHPHVYGDRDLESAGEVLAQWEQIKREVEGDPDPHRSLPDNLPALLYAVLVKAAQAYSPGRSYGELFVRYAYALLPIALFYHLAHNAEHFLMEGPRLLSLISDPFGWGWNLFGTARWTIPPLVSLEGLWRIQVLFVLLGHLYSLWITARTARRLISGRSGLLALQAPILVAMVAFSWVSLWLLKQPMEMRVSGQSFVTACASTCASEWRRLCSASECAGGMGLSYLILSPIPARARSHGLRATAGNPRSFSARFSQRRASPSCGRGG